MYHIVKKIGLLDVNKLDYAISMIIRKSIIVNHKNKNIYLSNGISHKPNFIPYIDKPVYFNKTYEIVKLVRYNEGYPNIVEFKELLCFNKI